MNPQNSDAEVSPRQAGVSPMPHHGGSVVAKVVAVVVFLALILIGTYFARISGPAILGYIIGAAAFIVAPMIWRAGGD